ncbi:helix-turn-helix transcriptional regulator [Aggregatibacter segnis]|jgi:hypothetical protein|uniref:helix-turn-helix domain-containing protein n=1 Tax=Aggregatibacter segnis TaxID=739 RepID=UPI000D69E849|nr:helix-turn-helix transcriptional regulator [Aggregatibacter segnis]
MRASDKLRQNIRDIREDKHFTQADMAEKLGLSITGYAKIERGQSQINIERLQQISKVLEVSIADLIPFGDDGVVVFNNSNDNFSNSSNFSLALGNPALEAEVANLRQILAHKNEIVESRDREINLLRQQVETLQKLISSLENVA